MRPAVVVLVASALACAGCGGSKVTAGDVTPCLSKVGIVVPPIVVKPPPGTTVAAPAQILTQPGLPQPEWFREIALNGHTGATNLRVVRTHSPADARAWAARRPVLGYFLSGKGTRVTYGPRGEAYGRYALMWNAHPSRAQHRRVAACLKK